MSESNEGLLLSGGGRTPLQSGNYFYWDATLQQIVMADLEKFCPSADFKPAPKGDAADAAFSVRFRHQAFGKELCKNSIPINASGASIPEDDVNGFIAALGNLHKKAETGSTRDAAAFIRDFRVPDPREMKEAWRVSSGAVRHLIVLWGYSLDKAGSAVKPLTDTSQTWEDRDQRVDLRSALASVALIGKSRINWRGILSRIFGVLLILLFCALVCFLIRECGSGIMEKLRPSQTEEAPGNPPTNPNDSATSISPPPSPVGLPPDEGQDTNPPGTTDDQKGIGGGDAGPDNGIGDPAGHWVDPLEPRLSPLPGLGEDRDDTSRQPDQTSPFTAMKNDDSPLPGVKQPADEQTPDVGGEEGRVPMEDSREEEVIPSVIEPTDHELPQPPGKSTMIPPSSSQSEFEEEHDPAEPANDKQGEAGGETAEDGGAEVDGNQGLDGHSPSEGIDPENKNSDPVPGANELPPERIAEEALPESQPDPVPDAFELPPERIEEEAIPEPQPGGVAIAPAFTVVLQNETRNEDGTYTPVFELLAQEGMPRKATITWKLDGIPQGVPGNQTVFTPPTAFVANREYRIGALVAVREGTVEKHIPALDYIWQKDLGDIPQETVFRHIAIVERRTSSKGRTYCTLALLSEPDDGKIHVGKWDVRQDGEPIRFEAGKGLTNSIRLFFSDIPHKGRLDVQAHAKHDGKDIDPVKGSFEYTPSINGISDTLSAGDADLVAEISARVAPSVYLCITEAGCGSAFSVHPRKLVTRAV